MGCGPSCFRRIAKFYGRVDSIQNLREKAFITWEGVSMLVSVRRMSLLYLRPRDVIYSLAWACCLLFTWRVWGYLFFTVKTSECSTILVLGYTDFVMLFRDFPEFRALMFRIAVHRFIRQESVEYVFRCFTAEERIVHFWKLHQLQEWIQHIPQYRIASWLNMTPETFAKIWGSLNRLRWIRTPFSGWSMCKGESKKGALSYFFHQLNY